MTCKKRLYHLFDYVQENRKNCQQLEIPDNKVSTYVRPFLSNRKNYILVKCTCYKTFFPVIKKKIILLTFLLFLH